MQEVLTILHDARKFGRLVECPIFASGLGMDLADYFDEISRKTKHIQFNRSVIKDLKIKPTPRKLAAGQDPEQNALYIVSSGMLVERTLGPGEVLRVDTGCLMALQPTVNYDIEYVGKIKSAIFGGEGLFVLQVTGTGLLLVASFGAIHRKQLGYGERYVVDTGHLVAWEGHMPYELRKASSAGWSKKSLYPSPSVPHCPPPIVPTVIRWRVRVLAKGATSSTQA